MSGSLGVEGAYSMHMMTVEAYQEQILQYRLVTGAQLEKVLQKLRDMEHASKIDVDLLSEALVESGLLTLWQHRMIVEGRAQRLLGGRHRGFFVSSYKLLKHLGTGGMNSVFLAEHTVMRRQVAIKVLSLSGEDDEAFLERFRMESRAIASLDHPNIVRAHDFNSDGDVYFLVMEYVEGKDLHHLVKERGPLPFEMAADFVRQAAEGLFHAHENHLIHRDIKPANLLVDRKKVVKLLDLGIARLHSADTEHEEECSITRASADNILGTADYLAPEQALDSHTVDARADIYSLGCTLYFLLTGHPPFPRGSLAQRMLMHQMQEPPAIYEDRPNAPPGLVEICQKMMAKKQDERYQTAKEVAAALENWLSTHKKVVEEEDLSRKRRGASDTFAGLGTSTTMGRTARKKLNDQQNTPKDSDSKIICRTCGTAFGRNMYRFKCPKCGTVNNPIANMGNPYRVGNGNYPAISPPPTGGIPRKANQETHNTQEAAGSSTKNNQWNQSQEAEAPEKPLDPTIKASCPKCQSTFTARWTKCLNCGAATVLHDEAYRTSSVDLRAITNKNDGNQPRGDTAESGSQMDLNRPAPRASFQGRPVRPTDPGERSHFSSHLSYNETGQDYNDRSHDMSHGYGTYTEDESVSLEDGMNPMSVAAERSRSLHVRGSQMSGSLVSSLPSQKKRRRKSRAKYFMVGGIGLLVLLALGGTGLFFFLTSQPSAASTNNTSKELVEGDLSLQGLQLDGKRNGHWIAWAQDGQKRWEGHYTMNQEQGHWSYWDESGQILSSGSYLNGNRHGQWLFLHPDGQIEKRGSFRENAPHGKWTFYYPHGGLKAQGTFENGQRVDTWKFWDENGDPIESLPDEELAHLSSFEKK
ncbi:Hypothetical protein PBC10988_7190 [Planctomycetales bacterium 10988]|nr:Hypothetical protein PBC10988_7190 [Planctomycetales bacterium 10988]